MNQTVSDHEEARHELTYDGPGSLYTMAKAPRHVGYCNSPCDLTTVGYWGLTWWSCWS